MAVLRPKAWPAYAAGLAVGLLGVLVFATPSARAASGEVDIRTPWANVYVGPGGVYVHGPWGRVDVPSSDRERVCREWRDSVLDHYKGRDCDVTFDDKACTIEKVDCKD